VSEFLEDALALFDHTQSIRRDLHQHPELGFQEFRTAGIVARELASLDMEVVTGIAQTGIVATLEGNSPGPVVLLRFDMDALPIQEQTGAPYASLQPGLMHACGHDGHVSIGLTVARLLHSRRTELHGTIKFIFQPAEEGLGGAERMIAEGILENPRPDFALCLHLWNEKPLGWMGVSAGPIMAAADIFTIQISGKGGHGGIPDQAVDSIAAAAQVISALQTITSRNVSPLHAAVVTVGSVHAGEAFNVIPDQVEMKGTIRTFEPAVRELVMQRIYAIVEGIAAAMGCQAQVNIRSLNPAVVNHPQVTSLVQTIAREMFPTHELSSDYRSMVSEDMSVILQAIPGCYFYIGSANPGLGLNFSHHHPRFDFDEQALPRAVALMTGAATALLQSR
jgi:amidohydrolase